MSIIYGMRPPRRSGAGPADGATRGSKELLPTEVLALLDHLAEEIAAEYIRLLMPEPEAPTDPDRLQEMEVER